MSYELYCGDCLEVLPTIASQSADCVITDPPYAEIDRAYGRLTEAQWWELMMGVCTQVRRILKPTGSAVFIIQPNSRVVGSMRGWVFEFMAWVCREWNMVQDVYWWNFTPFPTVHATQYQLTKPSVKPCVWAGAADCYRNQRNVLWTPSKAMDAVDVGDRALRYHPQGGTVRAGRIKESVLASGGSSPSNLLPVSNGDSTGSSGANGHGAGTPLPLASWWTRYICPPGGVLLDPFSGAGTMGLAAIAHGAHYIGIEQVAEYHGMAQARLRLAAAQPPLFPVAPEPPKATQGALIDA